MLNRAYQKTYQHEELLCFSSTTDRTMHRSPVSHLETSSTIIGEERDREACKFFFRASSDLEASYA